MARRRSGLNSSSLELLLDTICNTFGGVLFLAMLVSLMLTQTRARYDAELGDVPPTPALTPAQLARIEIEVEQLQAEVEQLAERADAAVEKLGPAVPADYKQQLVEMDSLEHKVTETESLRADLLADIAESQAAQARAQAALAESERAAESLEQGQAAARKRLADAMEQRRRLVASATELRLRESAASTIRATGQAPRERETSKSEFGVLLRYGRVYLMKVQRGSSLVVNEKDFTVTEADGTNRARAKPNAGLDLSAAEGQAEAIEQFFGAFPANRWYPCFVVHADSFTEFMLIKAEAVRMGYEYRVLPVEGTVVDQGGDAAVQ